MKLCFIYSGLSRTLVDSIKLLNDRMQSYDYDIYIHTEINEVDSSYLHKKINIESIYKLKNVKSILMDNKVSVPDIYKTEKEKNIYYQWHKINRIFSIINLYKYDYIIRIRSDLFLLEDIDKTLIQGFNNEKIYIPMGNDVCNGINDQFAIASPFIMKIYANLIHNIDKYMKNDYNCSEIILFQYLKDMNIQIERFQLNYKLVLSLCNTIGITGNSASGKTTVSKAIEKVFKFDKKIILETDRYHKWERGNSNWNNNTHLNPNANYLEKLQEDTFNLKLGNDIYAVDYNHKNGTFTPLKRIETKQNIIICGLHTLYHDKLRDIIDIKVYIDTDEKLQYYWKLKRDVNDRGHNESDVFKFIENRKDDYSKFILPQRQYSDIIINFYTNDDIDLKNWSMIKEPDIKLRISIHIDIYKIIKIEKGNRFFTIDGYDNNYINLIVNNNVNKDIIHKYLNIDFINIDDIYDGYYGVIQLLFALMIYKDAIDIYEKNPPNN